MPSHLAAPSTHVLHPDPSASLPLASLKRPISTAYPQGGVAFSRDGSGIFVDPEHEDGLEIWLDPELRDRMALLVFLKAEGATIVSDHSQPSTSIFVLSPRSTHIFDAYCYPGWLRPEDRAQSWKRKGWRMKVLLKEPARMIIGAAGGLVGEHRLLSLFGIRDSDMGRPPSNVITTKKRPSFLVLPDQDQRIGSPSSPASSTQSKRRRIDGGHTLPVEQPLLGATDHDLEELGSPPPDADETQEHPENHAPDVNADTRNSPAEADVSVLNDQTEEPMEVDEIAVVQPPSTVEPEENSEFALLHPAFRPASLVRQAEPARQAPPIPPIKSHHYDPPIQPIPCIRQDQGLRQPIRPAQPAPPVCPVIPVQPVQPIRPAQPTPPLRLTIPEQTTLAAQHAQSPQPVQPTGPIVPPPTREAPLVQQTPPTAPDGAERPSERLQAPHTSHETAETAKSASPPIPASSSASAPPVEGALTVPDPFRGVAIPPNQAVSAAPVPPVDQVIQTGSTAVPLVGENVDLNGDEKPVKQDERRTERRSSSEPIHLDNRPAIFVREVEGPGSRLEDAISIYSSDDEDGEVSGPTYESSSTEPARIKPSSTQPSVPAGSHYLAHFMAEPPTTDTSALTLRLTAPPKPQIPCPSQPPIRTPASSPPFSTTARPHAPPGPTAPLAMSVAPSRPVDMRNPKDLFRGKVFWVEFGVPGRKQLMMDIELRGGIVGGGETGATHVLYPDALKRDPRYLPSFRLLSREGVWVMTRTWAIRCMEANTLLPEAGNTVQDGTPLEVSPTGYNPKLPTDQLMRILEADGPKIHKGAPQVVIGERFFKMYGVYTLGTWMRLYQDWKNGQQLFKKKDPKVPVPKSKPKPSAPRNNPTPPAVPVTWLNRWSDEEENDMKAYIAKRTHTTGTPNHWADFAVEGKRTAKEYAEYYKIYRYQWEGEARKLKMENRERQVQMEINKMIADGLVLGRDPKGRLYIECG
ncbi:hypothetical protein P7C73_g2553, partial [Tremellales sp. Uapishka_1]